MYLCLFSQCPGVVFCTVSLPGQSTEGGMYIVHVHVGICIVCMCMYKVMYFEGVCMGEFTLL